MKKVALLFFFSFLAMTNIQGQEIEWLTLAEGERKMKEEPKKLFIDIVADWCKWCKVMEKETFSDPKVIKYVQENYYAVKLEYEDPTVLAFKGKEWKSKALATSWSVQDLPTIVFWDEGFSNKSLSRGYQDANQFLESLQLFAEF